MRAEREVLEKKVPPEKGPGGTVGGSRGRLYRAIYGSGREWSNWDSPEKETGDATMPAVDRKSPFDIWFLSGIKRVAKV